MTKSSPISPACRKPIFEALSLQALFTLLSSLLLDGGVTLRICAVAAIAFWCGALILISRRSSAHTPTDLAAIRLGYLPVVAIAFLFVYLIWVIGAR